MYWCAHKTATLTSIQHTVPPPGGPPRTLAIKGIAGVSWGFPGNFPVHYYWATWYDQEKNGVIQFSKNQIQKRFCIRKIYCSQHAATNSEITNPELHELCFFHFIALASD